MLVCNVGALVQVAVGGSCWVLRLRRWASLFSSFVPIYPFCFRFCSPVIAFPPCLFVALRVCTAVAGIPRNALIVEGDSVLPLLQEIEDATKLLARGR